MSTGRAGSQTSDDQPVALGDRKLDEPFVLAAHPVEGVRARHPNELAVDVVGPGVERAGEGLVPPAPSATRTPRWRQMLAMAWTRPSRPG